jgi:hypothetical protein
MNETIHRLLKWAGCFVAGMVVVNLCWVSSAWAQKGVGVRAGVSIDPEQFYFGGHITTGPVVDRLWFRPNVEVGVGDNSSSVGLNGEFAYFVPLQRRGTDVYFGAGPALNIFSSGPSRARHTSTGPGFNFVLGVAQRKGWFAEMKIGALDSPRFKFGIGYTFP